MRQQAYTIKKQFTLIALLFICLLTTANEGPTRIIPDTFPTTDSLRTFINNLHGEQKLDAYQTIYDDASLYDDPDFHIQFLREYIAESQNQNNQRHESKARAGLFILLYDLSLTDELMREYKTTLHRLRKLNYKQAYYIARFIYITEHCNSGDHEHALKEANDLYNEARHEEYPIGAGIALSRIALIYYFKNDFPKAEATMREAIRLMEDRTDIYFSIVNNAYSHLADILKHLENYTGMLEHTRRYEALLAKWEEKYPPDPYSVNRFYCHMAYSDAYLGLGQYENALRYLQHMEECAQQINNPLINATLTLCQSHYYHLTGHYTLALQKVEETLLIFKTQNSPDDVNSAKEKKADILLSAGRTREAAELYATVLYERDSLRNEQHTLELAELSTRYELDLITAEKERNHLLFTYALTVALLLALILTGWIIYSRRLTLKNRALRKRFEQENRMEDELERLRPTTANRQPTPGSLDAPEQTDTASTPESEIYQRLREFIKDPATFTAPDITAQQFALKLGTNRTYLYNALRDNLGMSFKEYITNLRISHAQHLLKTSDPDTTIDEIAQQAGFSSSSAFYRNFKEYVGITPKEYRRIN